MSDFNRGGNLLAFLRRRPWLGPCIIWLSIGPSLMASNSSRSLVFWMGAVVLVLGVLAILFSEMSSRKNRRA